jgi:UDP-glucose 4-epimerase
MKKKRLVIVGSGGFISTAVETKLKNKIEILCIPRQKIDLSKSTSIKKLSRKVKKNDRIFFIAAKAPCKNQKDYDYNLRIVSNFCKALSLNRNTNKIFYLSSDAVYSDTLNKINESSNAYPLNFHGLMHLSREIFLKINFPKKVSIFRPTLVYGANDPHNGYGPNKFKRNIIERKQIELFGKGEEIRDHIHISDVADIISKLILKDFNGLVNVVSGFGISFYKIAKYAIFKSKSDTKIKFLKRSGPIPHNGYRCFDNRKLTKELGFFPKKITNTNFFKT